MTPQTNKRDTETAPRLLLTMLCISILTDALDAISH